MKAYYLTKNGDADRAFELRDYDVESPGDDEVSIKVECFGLNFADVLARRGLYQDCPKLPCVIGYDVAGTVLESGSNADEFKVGDRVVALTRFGGYAQSATTMKEGVAKIPKDLPFAKATVLATQACTAYYCAYECGKCIRAIKCLYRRPQEA